MIVDAKELAAALRLAATALPSRAILPAYEYVSLKPYASGLLVTAIGPEMSIQIPIAGQSKTEVIVHAEKCLVALDGKSGEITLGKDRIAWPGGYLAFQPLNTSYASMDAQKWVPAGTLVGNYVAACLNALAPIVDDSTELDPFGCVWAADGFLYGGSRSITGRYAVVGSPSFHLHRSKIQKVAKILKEGGEWEVESSTSAYRFNSEGFVMTVAKTEHAMPRFSMVFDQATSNPALFDVPVKPSDLASAATSVSQAFGSTSLVQLSADGGTLRIKHEDTFSQEIAMSRAAKFAVNFNVAYLIPAMLQAERIQMTNHRSPWVLTKGSFTGLMMPYFYE